MSDVLGRCRVGEDISGSGHVTLEPTSLRVPGGVQRAAERALQRNLAEAIVWLCALKTFRRMEGFDFAPFAGAPKGTLIWDNPNASMFALEPQVLNVLVSPPGGEYAGMICVMGESPDGSPWQVDLYGGKVERLI